MAQYDNPEILYIRRALSYSQGWTGEVRWGMQTSAVAAFITATVLTPFPDTGVPAGTSSSGIGAVYSVVPLYPQSFQIDPIPDSVIDQYGKSAYSFVTVHYAPDYYDVEWPSDIPRPDYKAGTTLKLKIRFSGQFLTLPSRAVAAISPGSAAPNVSVATGYAPGVGSVYAPPSANANNRILIPLSDYHIEWDRVTATDTTLAFLQSVVGNVNNATFLGQPAETLLLDGVDVDHSHTINTANHWRYKITCVFKGRKIKVPSGGGTFIYYGWNHDYHENPPGWARIVMADGHDRYLQGGFTALFTGM